MKYTFLLPAYKSRFLQKALLSIQAQTYKDFAVIISDDCSPEPLMNIVQPFLKDSRFSYRRNDSNIGAVHLTDHWNLLLSMCHSPFLIIAGDDDLYEPDFLSEIDQLAARHPGIHLLRSQMDQINPKGAVIRSEPPFVEFENQADFAHSLFEVTHIHGIGQYVFNTEALRTKGGFKFLPLAWFSDDATAIMCSDMGVAHSSKVLFHLRISDISITGSIGHPHFDQLKARSVVLFYKWFRRMRFDRRPCRDYCCHMLWGLWGNLPRIQQLSAILTFPVLAGMILKERLTN